MQISPARLNTIRGALGIFILLALFWGIGQVFVPEQVHKMTSPKEPFTAAFQGLYMGFGAFILAYAVAAAIALRDPLRHRGLVQAVIVALVIEFVVTGYVLLAVTPEVPAAGWISEALLIILAVVLGVAYPWAETT